MEESLFVGVTEAAAKDEDGVTAAGIKGMVAGIGFQCFGKGLQDNTSKKVCVMLPWKCENCKPFLKKFSDVKLHRFL